MYYLNEDSRHIYAYCSKHYRRIKLGIVGVLRAKKKFCCLGLRTPFWLFLERAFIFGLMEGGSNKKLQDRHFY